MRLGVKKNWTCFNVFVPILSYMDKSCKREFFEENFFFSKKCPKNVTLFSVIFFYLKKKVTFLGHAWCVSLISFGMSSLLGLLLFVGWNSVKKLIITTREFCFHSKHASSFTFFSHVLIQFISNVLAFLVLIILYWKTSSKNNDNFQKLFFSCDVYRLLISYKHLLACMNSNKEYRILAEIKILFLVIIYHT